jgi:hypothetical protein
MDPKKPGGGRGPENEPSLGELSAYDAKPDTVTGRSLISIAGRGRPQGGSRDAGSSRQRTLTVRPPVNPPSQSENDERALGGTQVRGRAIFALWMRTRHTPIRWMYLSWLTVGFSGPFASAANSFSDRIGYILLRTVPARMASKL